ncbi:hypothetical protein BC832DRAFT_135283 [Gaertneriomyces semiglobifer]|nr:hypothetical protein BC832DRAFT_135283 [Gaertneriomyces semiglobifer]
MTKAERRALQEQQRAAKAAARQGGGAAPKRDALNAPSGPNPARREPQRPTNPQTPTASNRSSLRVAATMRQDDPKARSKIVKSQPVNRELAQKPVPLFSHLPQYEKSENIQANLKKQENIHPLVLTLGLRFANMTIAGGNARCVAMLLAFKQVITDYSTPVGTSLPRHLPTIINKQVDFLTTIRPLCASMRTAVRELKKKISVVSPDVPDNDAKELLCSQIDTFKSERIELASRTVVEEAMKHHAIKDGDVIMTYGNSSTVTRLILKAHSDGIKFEVVVVDGRPLHEGKALLKALTTTGIKCRGCLISGIGKVMKDDAKRLKVIIGTSALLANGAILGRVGTASICCLAKTYQIKVIALCESYKFSDECRLDSFTWNEIGNPEDIVDTKSRTLDGWRRIEPLKILNIHYDITPSIYVEAVSSEYGLLPPTTSVSIIREQAEKSQDQRI